MGHGAHERFVAVLDMAVDHIEVAFIYRQVHGFANGAAGMVQARTHVSQLDEIAKVFDCRVTPAVIQVANERRTISRDHYGTVAADNHAPLRVARMLGEFRRGRCADDGAAHALGKPHPFSFYVRAGVP